MCLQRPLNMDTKDQIVHKTAYFNSLQFSHSPMYTPWSLHRLLVPRPGEIRDIRPDPQTTSAVESPENNSEYVTLGSELGETVSQSSSVFSHHVSCLHPLPHPNLLQGRRYQLSRGLRVRGLKARVWSQFRHGLVFSLRRDPDYSGAGSGRGKGVPLPQLSE